jgi:SH3-like domain-containing protein
MSAATCRSGSSTSTRTGARSRIRTAPPAVYQDWRKIEDPDGAAGWMLVTLLSDTRTAIVRGTELRPMFEDRDERSAVRYRAEPGVVGRISRCNAGWCWFDVGGRAGFIRTDFLWGLGRNEMVE